MGTPCPPGVERCGSWSLGSLSGFRGTIGRRGGHSCRQWIVVGSSCSSGTWRPEHRGRAGLGSRTRTLQGRAPPGPQRRPTLIPSAFPGAASGRHAPARPLPAAHAQSGSGRRGLLSAPRPRPAPRPRAAERSARGGGGRIHGVRRL